MNGLGTDKRYVHSLSTIERVRRLWGNASLTTEDIGRKLRISKSAVIGIGYRNNFPAKPYPSKRFIRTPEGVWPSIRAAARAHGLCPATAQYRVTRRLFGWGFADEQVTASSEERQR